MKEQSDTLVNLIHDAAGQVGPVAGIDGETMARRAIRHERTRRGVIGGVMTLAVAALVTVGGMMATGKQVLPAGWPFGDGWQEVSGGGLTFSVPPEFEGYVSAEGYPTWDKGEEPTEMGEPMPSTVMVVPADESEPLSGTYPDAVDTEVPGAVSGQYAVQTESVLGDLDGALDVELESGHTVRLSVVLTDMPDPEEAFERIVESVRVDPDATDEDLEMQGPALDVIEEHPADWAVQEHQGLRFAVPGDWVEGDRPAGRDDAWPTMTMDDGAGEVRLRVTASGATGDEDLVAYSYDLALPSGADQGSAELAPMSGTLYADVEVRREGGRTYSVSVSVPEGEEGDRIVRTIAGSLEFTAEADDLPAYEDLADARDLVDAAPDVPDDWVTVSDVAGVSLRVPADWTDMAGGDGTMMRVAPTGVPEEAVRAWLDEPGIPGNGVIPLGGYRLDVPGGEQATIRLDQSADEGEAMFDAHVEIELADGSHVQVGFDGPEGPETEERFWQILGTLEVGTD